MTKRKRIWKKQGHYWFFYIGKHRWLASTPKYARGRIWYYSKRQKSFYAPAPKNGGGLAGLKSWWKSHRKKKYGK